MVTYLKPEDIKSFNLDTLKGLKKLVSDEAQRYALIGLSLKLGDYNARKELPDHFFSNRRQITFRIELATYIVQQQITILSQLKSKTPQEVIDLLKKTRLEDNLRESEISNMLKKSDLATLGKRVEIRFSSMNPTQYEAYKKTLSDHTLNQILLGEAETIIHAVAYENETKRRLFL